jgi:hypothetical protein
MDRTTWVSGTRSRWSSSGLPWRRGVGRRR